MPEPEPVEYVKVCDAAGTGYFYIPGTDTCLEISGEVIYYLKFRNTDDSTDTLDFDNTGQDGWEKEYEISLDFNTWKDTEYGDLTTSIQLGASSDTVGEVEQFLGDGGVAVNEAFITLGGLTIGYTDSFYPGGNGASDLDGEGPDTGIIGYTVDFASGSFSMSLEDDGNVDWMPAMVGVVSAEFGDVSVAAAAVYDDTQSFWGAQLHAEYSAGALGIDASVQYSSDSDLAHPADTTRSRYSAGYEWVLGLGMDYDVNDKLTVFAGLDYGINQMGTVSNANDIGTNDDFLLEVGADYELVDGFTVSFQADFSDRTTGTFEWEDAEISFTRSF
ncbi:MAG: porin [Pseudomonadota bacterium]